MSLNPWLALILGILIGWLLEWLLELWFFRRRRLECQRRLARAEAELQAREAELSHARAHGDLLATDLTALRTSAELTAVKAEAAVSIDRLSVRVGPADSEMELPEAEVAAPVIAAEVPDTDLPQADLPGVDFDALKDKVAGGVDAAGGLVAGLVSKLGGEGGVPDRPAEELPASEEPLPPFDFDRLAARVELPEAEVPDVAAGAPQADVDWPEIGVRVAAVGAELPGAALDAPAPSAAALFEADDLTQIAGIGPKYAAQLAAAGFTSYAALGAAQPEQLEAAIGAPAWRRLDTSAWIAGAQALAGQVRAPEASDDLTLLEGIGPVYAAKLNEAGIRKFADLAAADEASLGGIIQAPAWRRVSYGDWVEQARLAAAGDWEGLKALQAALFSRQSDNLGLVSGVGAKTARALNQAGITTFSALAAADPEQLAQITRNAGVRGGDFGAWVEEAKQRASGKRIIRAPRAGSGRMASCPQDLSRVKGIGSAYEAKLYAAAIGTFWELAQTDDEELVRILELKDFQELDLAALKSSALSLAEATGAIGRRWDGTTPDDFEPLEGIGGVYEGRLYDAGICTYHALAGATVEQLAEICQAPEWRTPDYASWIAQAKRLLGQEA